MVIGYYYILRAHYPAPLLRDTIVKSLGLRWFFKSLLYKQHWEALFHENMTIISSLSVSPKVTSKNFYISYGKARVKMANREFVFSQKNLLPGSLFLFLSLSGNTFSALFHVDSSNVHFVLLCLNISAIIIIIMKAKPPLCSPQALDLKLR